MRGSGTQVIAHHRRRGQEQRRSSNQQTQGWFQCNEEHRAIPYRTSASGPQRSSEKTRSDPRMRYESRSGAASILPAVGRPQPMMRPPLPSGCGSATSPGWLRSSSLRSRSYGHTSSVFIRLLPSRSGTAWHELTPGRARPDSQPAQTPRRDRSSAPTPQHARPLDDPALGGRTRWCRDDRLKPLISYGTQGALLSVPDSGGGPVCSSSEYSGSGECGAHCVRGRPVVAVIVPES